MEGNKPENSISGAVVSAAVRVHQVLGAGLLESAYEAALEHELRRRGLGVRRQVPIDIWYGDLHIERAFFADMIVNGRVLVELKVAPATIRAHEQQLMTYLRLSGLKLGLLLNFGVPLMKDGISRRVNGL